MILYSKSKKSRTNIVMMSRKSFSIITTSLDIVYVCVPMPTQLHASGFRARQIDDVECGLFSIHAPLGQTTLCVGQVSLWCTGGS